MNSIIIILLCGLAGVFKAVADTLSHHFEVSVFSKRSRKFWDPSVSWSTAKFLPFTKYRFDAWHVANSLSICSLIAAGVLQRNHNFMIRGWVDFICLGAVYIVAFNQFYNHILIKKP